MAVEGKSGRLISVKLREKGFHRQATLLESRANRAYIHALTNPRWETEVRNAFGGPIYGELQLIELMALPDQDTHPVVEERPFDYPTYTRNIDHKFCFEDLMNSGRICNELANIKAEALEMVFSGFRDVAANDENLLIEVYKDWDLYSEMIALEESEQLSILKRIVYGRCESLERQITAETPPMLNDTIVSKSIELLLQVLPCAYQQHAGQDLGKLVTDLDAIEVMIHEARAILTDPEKLCEVRTFYLESLESTTRERILKTARAEIELFTIMNKDEDMCLGFSEYGIYHTFTYDFELDYKAEGLEDALQQLFHAPLDLRQTILEDYEGEVNGGHGRASHVTTLAGLLQIISGGKITNPNVPEVSVLQNHAALPNIRYPAQIIQQLKPLVKKYQQLFDDLPDIDDLAISSKLRKRKSITYAVEEIPKNPLDVTVANDSGSCLYVPEQLKDLGNGVFIPYYLTLPQIRQFGVYRVQGERKHRMGSIRTFDVTTSDGRSILAANSLELSRYHIIGGKQTLQKLARYAEDFLAAYAEKFGYDGVVMGAHSYNTSTNFSSKSKDLVKDRLTFKTEQPFYSDIFVWNPEQETLTTREKSCYWLWQK